MRKDSRRGKRFWFGLTLLSISALYRPLSSETRYVSKTGSNEPPYTTLQTAATTIQAALDRSSRGDTVLVGPGDYEESITLERDGMTLIGAGRDCCRILVPEGEDVAGIVGESRVVELRGFAVIGGQTGIFLFGGNQYMLITDCLVEGAGQCGLLIQGWVDISVLDTVFRGVPSGIQVIRDDDPWAEVGLRVSGCDFVDTVEGIHVGSECTTEVTECSFLRYRYGMYDTWGAATLADSCTFLQGRCGVSAMTMAGVLRVSDCVFAFNTGEAIETDQRGLVTDSLFYANNYAYSEWDGGNELDFVGCTFVFNRTALDLIPRVTRDCIFWENGEDVLHTYDNLWPQTCVLEHCFINDSRFVGRDGNVSGDPEFVGWGAFNETDNPMHVCGSAAPGGDGTVQHPFRSLGEALLSFDFRLREGSVCLGAGSLGGNIGYPAGTAPSAASRSDRVAIALAPGSYEVGDLVIPQSVTVYGAEGAGKRPVVQGKKVHIGEGARIRGLAIEQADISSFGAELSDCEFRRGTLAIRGGAVARCKILDVRTYLSYGTPGVRMASTLFVGTAEFAALSISNCPEPHELVNCTIISPVQAIALSQYYEGTNARLTNCIISGLVTGNPDQLVTDHCLFSGGWDGEGNLVGDPMFVDAEKGDFRLWPQSPCIDAGDNAAATEEETDLAGMHRIMYGGNSLTVDMGAYEYCINRVRLKPPSRTAALIWSSLSNVSYSVFYTEDLLTWHLAEENVPSAGDMITFWTDDGSKTGIAPTLAPLRFYRVLENP